MANDGLIEANAGFERLLKEQAALPAGFEQLIAGLENWKEDFFKRQMGKVKLFKECHKSQMV